MSDVAFISSTRFIDHVTVPAHPERPDRLRAIHTAVRRAGLITSPNPFGDFAIDFAPSLLQHTGKPLIEIAPQPSDESVVERVHPRTTIERIRAGCARSAVLDESDTPTCPASFDVALLGVGALLSACTFVMGGEGRRAFAAIRPPGHHAERERPMGFCLFGNIAIAARHLQHAFGLKRIAIVDFDVHHGNGTQDVFYDDPNVLIISIHEDPRTCYPHTGFAEEAGSGAGVGSTINIPMSAGARDLEYEAAFDSTIIPALDRFRPEVLLISAGFDAHADDPLARVMLSDDAFTMMTRKLVGVADRHCAGRIVSALEGGYDLGALGRGVVRHLIELAR